MSGRVIRVSEWDRYIEPRLLSAPESPKWEVDRLREEMTTLRDIALMLWGAIGEGTR